MFYAINKNTKTKVFAYDPNYTEDFFKDETWLADPNLILEAPPKTNKNEIQVTYNKRSKDIISNKGTIFFRSPHFSIPDKEKLGIKIKPECKEHTKCVSIITQLLNQKKITLTISQTQNTTHTKEIPLENIDFEKHDIEITISDHTNKCTADIYLPFKIDKKDNLLGNGIVIEVQLTKQREKTQNERSFTRAIKGFSVCWLTPEHFDDINKEDPQLLNTTLQITPATTIIQEYKKQMTDEIKQLTINYTLMIENKLNELNEAIIKSHPPFVQCPKCNGLQTKKYSKNNNQYFYGCSNYPTCKYTMRM